MAVSADLFYRRAAKASWVAPLVVVGLQVVFDQTQRSGAVGAKGIAAMAPSVAFILLLGLAAGIAALAAVRKYGRPGIFKPALVGVIIDAVLLSLMAVGFVSGFTRAVARNEARWRSEGARAVLGAGWLGAASGGDFEVTVVEPEPTSELAAVVRASYREPASIVVVTLDNSRGDRQRTIDLGSAVVRFSDGSSTVALPRQRVLASATPAGAAVRDVAAKPFTVAAGGHPRAEVAFFPPGLSMASAVVVDLLVDGQPLAVTGRVFSAAEKAALLAKNRQASP